MKCIFLNVSSKYQKSIISSQFLICLTNNIFCIIYLFQYFTLLIFKQFKNTFDWEIPLLIIYY